MRPPPLNSDRRAASSARTGSRARRPERPLAQALVDEVPAVTGAALLALFALGLLWLRAIYARSFDLKFLIWNLFLACLPVGFGALAGPLIATRRHRLAAGATFAAWLVFLPNAPYLVTDLLHLVPKEPAPFWFDTIVYGAFALTGVLLGVVSMALVQNGIASAYGAVVGWVSVVLLSGLCGVGVYLGRFLRWNSWDVLGDPKRVLADVAAISDPRNQPRAWAVSALIGGLLLASHLLVKGVARSLAALAPVARDRSEVPRDR